MSLTYRHRVTRTFIGGARLVYTDSQTLYTLSSMEEGYFRGITDQ